MSNKVHIEKGEKRSQNTRLTSIRNKTVLQSSNLLLYH